MWLTIWKISGKKNRQHTGHSWLTVLGYLAAGHVRSVSAAGKASLDRHQIAEMRSRWWHFFPIGLVHYRHRVSSSFTCRSVRLMPADVYAPL